MLAREAQPDKMRIGHSILFLPECDNRIDSNRPPGRNTTCCQCDREKQDGNSDKDDQVVRADAI